MTYSYNQNLLNNHQAMAYEIGDWNSSSYEYIDDENSFSVEYVYRVQIVEADTDTGADFGDEQWELLVTLNGEKTLYDTEEWLTSGRFQDLVQRIIKGLNHGYPVDEIIESR